MAEYNLQFEKLCSLLGLGRLIAAPEELNGGHLHRMYGIQTDKGRYAVKALNPQVMQRIKAMPDIINSERIARLAAKQIPVVPALVFRQSPVQQIDGQFYLVFDWINGSCIYSSQIRCEHCQRMGSILAKLHRMDFSQLELVDEYTVHGSVDWEYYLNKGEENGAVWTALLRENIENLNTWSSYLGRGVEALSKNTVISHGDLEPKNVLWVGSDPWLIDWEGAGYLNPRCDMVETAVYWSKDEKGEIIKEKFMAFIDGYKRIYGPVHADWMTVLYSGFSGLIGWLEYSLKRSLWIECGDEAEQKMGTDHVIQTINAALRYAQGIPRLYTWLCSV